MDDLNWKNPERVKRRRPTTLQRYYPKQAPYREAYQEYPLPDMTTQVKMVREQLLKLQSTLENIQKFVDSLNLKNPPSSSDWIKNLHSLDYRQMMTLLQSPEIQALVETFAQDESSRLKKEEG